MGTWDAYRASRRHKIDLTEIGLEGFWVEVRSFKSFSIAEAQRLDEARLAEGASMEEMRQSMYKTMPILIVSWNLTDPDSGEVLPAPREDKAVLDRIPLEVLSHINAKLTELEGGTAVPEVKGT